MTRQRHDRTGELVDVDEPAHRCARGWLAPAADGSARPCLICKPHLRGRAEPFTDVDRDRVRRGVEQCRAAITPREDPS